MNMGRRLTNAVVGGLVCIYTPAQFHAAAGGQEPAKWPEVPTITAVAPTSSASLHVNMVTGHEIGSVLQAAGVSRAFSPQEEIAIGRSFFELESGGSS